MFLNIIYSFGDGSFGAKSSLKAMLIFVYPLVLGPFVPLAVFLTLLVGNFIFLTPLQVDCQFLGNKKSSVQN